MRSSLRFYVLALISALLIMGACAGQEQPVSPLLSADAFVSQENTLPVLPSAILPGATGTVLAKCSYRGIDALSITESQNEGWCALNLPLDFYAVRGYSMEYPDFWTVQLVGAESMNLAFNQGIKNGDIQELFIQIVSTTLPLEQADQASYSFEMSGPSPLVAPDEEVVYRATTQVGDKQVLDLVTTQNGKTIQRYFLLSPDEDWPSAYMFKTAGDNEQMSAIVKQMISSMTFVSKP